MNIWYLQSEHPEITTKMFEYTLQAISVHTYITCHSVNSLWCQFSHL